MGDQGLHARLSNLINQFSYKYNVKAVDGALAQLWTRHTSQGGECTGVLSTQNAPFAIMGSSDQLALYKYESSKYRPRCDGAVAACAISRVFAGMQPELTGDVSREADNGFNRAAEAQRCGIHSTLLLAVYDDSLAQLDPVAVFELAQHEVDVDFGRAVGILQEVAKEHGFWIPSLQAARSVNQCEMPVELLQDAPATSSGSSSSSCHSSLASIHASVGALAHKALRVPTPPCAKAARQRVRGSRRCACLIADAPQHAAGVDQSSAPAQQQQPQKGHARAPRVRPPSVIVTDHIKPAVEALLGDVSSRRSRSRQHTQELPDHHPYHHQQQQQFAQPLQPLRGAVQLPISASCGISNHSSLSSAAIPSTPSSKPHHHRCLSGGRRSLDGCSTLSRMGRAHSSHDPPRSSSTSGWSQRLDPSAVGLTLRRAATPPPHESAAWYQAVSHSSSRFANSTSGSTISPQQQQQHAPLPHHQLQQQGFSPFQSGAAPSMPGRCLTPPHHPHRHITSRTTGLQLQAVLGGARAKQREEQERLQAEQQQLLDQQQQRDQQQPQQLYLQHHWQDVQQVGHQHQQQVQHFQQHQNQQQQQQHAPQQHSLVQQLQQPPQYGHPHMPPTADMQRMTTPAKQPQEWHDPFAAAAAQPSFERRRTSADGQLQSRSLFASSCNSEPLPGTSATGSSSSSSGGQSSKDRVRALVAHGGSFKHTGVGGSWEYLGGAQKLVGVPRSAGIAELQRQLSNSGAGQVCKMKYALPGSAGPSTTYVDLETEEDVETMWEEVDDYTSTHQGFKLQLYVESLGAASSMGLDSRSSFALGASSAYASSDSGRDSGGSDVVRLASGLLTQQQAGSGALQPDTPAQSGALPTVAAFAGTPCHAESSICPPTEQVGQLVIAKSDSDPYPPVRPSLGAATAAGSGYAAAAAAAAAAMGSDGSSSAVGRLHSQQLQQQHEGRALVPIYSGLPLQDSSTLPSAGSSGCTAVAAATDTKKVQQGSDDLESYVAGVATATAMAAAAQQFAAQGNSPVAAKLPPVHNTALAAADSASKCNSHGSTAVYTATTASSSASSISSSHSHSRRPAVQVLSEGSAAQVQPSNLTTMDDRIRQKQEQLKQLVAELEGRVEIVMPYDLNIVRFLGGGAFGEVYLSKWHGTDVAVKCLSPSLISGEQSSGTPCADAVAELLKEAAVLASLHHPNIVSVFGVVLPPSELLTSSSVASELEQHLAANGGKSQHEMTVEELTDELLAGESARQDGSFAGASSSLTAVAKLGVPVGLHSFAECRAAMATALSQGHPPAPAIVTEYLSLGSLRSAISNRAEWLKGTMARAKLMLDTARGLDYLHSKRLVHFDLKSANLLVTMKDKVPCIKLADMGLTKQRRQTFVSGVNSLRGTLPWIAPEIVKSPDSVTEKADCWSFGVVMWELWTMQEPFEGVHLHALLHQLATPAGLSLPVPGTPEWADADCPAEPAPGWCALMQRCWLPPDERPSSRQLVAALDEMMEQIRAERRRISEAGRG